jgi:hypothetical protein
LITLCVNYNSALLLLRNNTRPIGGTTVTYERRTSKVSMNAYDSA